MKFSQITSLAILAMLLGSCRSDRLKAPVIFDPLSIGPAGPTLKKYLERNETNPKRSHALVSVVKIEASLPGLEKKGDLVGQKRRSIDEGVHVAHQRLDAGPRFLAGRARRGNVR